MDEQLEQTNNNTNTNNEDDVSSSSLDIHDWEVDDVCKWLNLQGFGDLEGAFREHDIDGIVLMTLTLEELKEDLNITRLGTRKRLYLDIQSLVESQQKEEEEEEEEENYNIKETKNSSREIKISETECIQNGGFRGIKRTLSKSMFSRAIIPPYFSHSIEGGGRPNYFLGLRIRNDAFLSTVEQLQKDAISRYPDLSPWASPPVKSHLTLFVMEIDEKENELHKAQILLEQCQDIIDEFYPPGYPPELKFNKTEHFDRRVFYAAPKDGPAKAKLASFAFAIHKRFKENDIRVNRFDFVPHATIFKAPRRKKHRRIKSIPSDIIADYAENSFGKGVFDGVDLTQMSATDSEGYYKVISQIPFNTSSSSSSSSLSSKNNSSVQEVDSSIVTSEESMEIQ